MLFLFRSPFYRREEGQVRVDPRRLRRARCGRDRFRTRYAGQQLSSSDHCDREKPFHGLNAFRFGHLITAVAGKWPVGHFHLLYKTEIPSDPICCEDQLVSGWGIPQYSRHIIHILQRVLDLHLRFAFLPCFSVSVRLHSASQAAVHQAFHVIGQMTIIASTMTPTVAAEADLHLGRFVVFLRNERL